MNRSDTSSHCVRPSSCLLLRHRSVCRRAFTEPVISVLSLVCSVMAGWPWTSPHSFPEVNAPGRMCVYVKKNGIGKKKKTLLPQSLHWLLWMSEGVEMAHLAQSCHWIPCPCCLDMFTGGEQPSTDNRSEASHRRAAAQRDLLIVSSNSLYFQRSKGLWPRPVHTLKANQHRLALVTAILIIIDRRNQYMLITLIGSPSSLNIKNWNVLNFWHHVNSAAFNFVPVKVVIFFCLSVSRNISTVQFSVKYFLLILTQVL